MQAHDGSITVTLDVPVEEGQAGQGRGFVRLGGGAGGPIIATRDRGARGTRPYASVQDVRPRAEKQESGFTRKTGRAVVPGRVFGVERPERRS